jgi:hypothetical protein
MAKQPRELTEGEKIHALQRLADLHWKSFDGNRLQEWKANFSLWAALGAFAGLALSGRAEIPRTAAVLLTIMIAGIFIVYWTAWTTGMWRRNEIDLNLIKEITQRIREIIDEPTASPVSGRSPRPQGNAYDHLRVWGNWSRRTQLLWTGLFAGVAIVSLWSVAK